MDRKTSSGHTDSSASQPERDAASAFAWTPRLSAMNIAADVVRHMAPLLPLCIFNGNFASYLLLTALDLSLGLMLIVGTTRDRSDPTSVDPRSRWLAQALARGQRRASDPDRNVRGAVLFVDQLRAFGLIRAACPLHRAAGVLRRATGFGTTDFSQAMARKIMTGRIGDGAW